MSKCWSQCTEFTEFTMPISLVSALHVSPFYPNQNSCGPIKSSDERSSTWKLTMRKAAPINRFLCSRSRSLGKTRPKHCWLAKLLSGNPSHSDFNLPIFAAWNKKYIRTWCYWSTYRSIEQTNLFNAAHVSPWQDKEQVAFVILHPKIDVRINLSEGPLTDNWDCRKDSTFEALHP